jgi:hypothetical protein
MNTVQMAWCLGPTMDWLAFVEGVRENTLAKSLENVEVSFVRPTCDGWTEPAIYNLATDTFYKGERNGELVYFFITDEGVLTRLTEQEFLDQVYERYAPNATLPAPDETNLVSFGDHGQEQVLNEDGQPAWSDDPPASRTSEDRLRLSRRSTPLGTLDQRGEADDL